MRSVGQIVYDGVLACRKCAYTGMTEGRVQHINNRRVYDDLESQTIASILSGAKKRCTNSRAKGFQNYGGRWITFDFPDIPTAVAYVMAELGPRPSGKTLDRIDNNKGYQPGNLRWADGTTQRLNQRDIPRTGPDFERLARLRELRPDYSWESLRQYVKRGMTDEEIINRKKGKHYGTFIGQNLRYR